MPLLATRAAGSARGFGFAGGSLKFMVATGGTITEQGDYYLHTFNSTATFAIVKASNTFPTYDWFLMGAGGAGGGGQVHGPAGNGGAAGIKKNANSVTGNVGNNVITIGSGGTKVGNGAQQGFSGNAGNSSNAFSQTATAGNAGQGYPQSGRNGGNNAQHSGSGGATSRDGGSGAGAGGSAPNAVQGGIGVQTALANGSNTYFGGGGGTLGGSGGQGGGGGWQAGAGSTNTGSGGGGGYSWGGGGNGAAGVCFVRYQVKGS